LNFSPFEKRGSYRGILSLFLCKMNDLFPKKCRVRVVKGGRGDFCASKIIFIHNNCERSKNQNLKINNSAITTLSFKIFKSYFRFLIFQRGIYCSCKVCFAFFAQKM
jgi:hypothetical protein